MRAPRGLRRLFGWIIVLAAAGFGLAMVAERGTFAPSLPESEAGGHAIAVGAAGHRTEGRVYFLGGAGALVGTAGTQAGTAGANGPLVVVLHGDAPFHKPGYQYFFASELAKAAPGTNVAALLRPGYSDPYGGRSDGDRGFAFGENYTPEVIEQVASAIQALKVQLNASAVIVVGHSGGAAIGADLAALHPGLVQQVILVGCPCDVPAFRLHMARMQSSPLWLFPVRSLSPLETLSRMGTGTKVTAISGAEDPIALPQYAEAYVAKAHAQGISATMTLLPNKGHEILNEPEVIRRVAEIVRTAR